MLCSVSPFLIVPPVEPMPRSFTTVGVEALRREQVSRLWDDTIPLPVSAPVLVRTKASPQKERQPELPSRSRLAQTDSDVHSEVGEPASHVRPPRCTDERRTPSTPSTPSASKSLATVGSPGDQLRLAVTPEVAVPPLLDQPLMLRPQRPPSYVPSPTRASVEGQHIVARSPRLARRGGALATLTKAPPKQPPRPLDRRSN